MKKYIVVLVFSFFVLSACEQKVDYTCGAGTIEVDGKCVADTVTCDDGYHKEDGDCVPDELTCNPGYHVEDGTCVADDEETCDPGYHEENGVCVIDVVECQTGYENVNGTCVLIQTNVPDWFDGWNILQEPIGDKGLQDLVFTETGFSATLDINERVGIIMTNLTLQPGYSYEVKFDFESDVAGKGLFVQLQAHGGVVFTNPGIMTNGSSQSFSQTLPVSPDANGTTDGWFTIELTPSGVAGTVTISNIELVETALPTCGANEVLDGLTCIPANNGYLPNGTPTAWFDGWAILTVPSGSKDISDLNFTETGYTVYLAEGDRSGIELMNYVFESGYTYELTFTYTASVAGRMVWVQMEALGGYGFTNTDTWTVDGTATFSQSLTIPSSYTPVETGWIKIELAPGALDNVTIDQIQIIRTPN